MVSAVFVKEKMTKRVLVTGSAGFIGFHLSQRLLKEGFRVIGIDNVNDYYDVQLKLDRLTILKNNNYFQFHKIDLADRPSLKKVFETEKIGADDCLVNLAAQAGVRYSRQNPDAYIQSNLIGFFNVLECSRTAGIKHLLYASSSSVYGGNTKLPFSVHDLSLIHI